MKEEAQYSGMLCEARNVAQARRSRSGCILERPHGEGSVALFFHDNPNTSVRLVGRDLRRAIAQADEDGKLNWERWFEPRGGPPAEETRDEMPIEVEEVDLGETDEVEAPVTATEEKTSDASAAVPDEGQEGVEVGK